jgi:predicted nicotinamide N-methyase
LIIPSNTINGQRKSCTAACTTLPFSHTHFTIAAGKEHLNLASPANPDDVLEGMTNEQYEKDKFMPYWAYQWPCATVIYNYLCAHATTIIPQNSLVCELGCGLGILSALLNKNRIKSIAIDIAPDACKYADYNIKSNGAGSAVVCLDWRAIPFTAEFDFVIGADILYEDRWIPTVLGFLDQTLKTGGSAIFADPQRNWWPVFKRAAQEKQYLLSTILMEKINEGKTEVELLKVTKQY